MVPVEDFLEGLEVSPELEATIDPALWGKNFPRQYDGYKRTVDMERTRYGGSEADKAGMKRGDRLVQLFLMPPGPPGRLGPAPPRPDYMRGAGEPR